MNQADVVARVAAAHASWRWVPLQAGVEVMAWPAIIDGVFVGVSARTASACAAALNRDGWIVSLTTPKIEDLIYERAALRPEPVLLNPRRINIASVEAVAEHTVSLLSRLREAPPDALVACGKSWVLCNDLLARPGRAANYGLFSATGPYRSATGAYRLWQPLSFAHNLDHWDYSQLLRLVRRRPGTPLPAYDEPLRVFELVRASTAAVLPPPRHPSCLPRTKQRRNGPRQLR